jgi:hypothetical protein
MTNPLQFSLGNRTYRFVNVDALESFVLEHTHYAKQLGDAVDREINPVKRQTFIESLAEVTQLIWKGGDLLNEIERSSEVSL